MLQFIPNFEVWSAFCPNPNCSGGERLPDKNEAFKTGVGIEVYIQDGMETLGVFALGSQSFAVCAQCFTLVPVPCLFPNKKAGEFFWVMAGGDIVREFWKEMSEQVFPSFLGITLGDQKEFEEKQVRISRALEKLTLAEKSGKYPPFLFLEIGNLNHLSRSFQE